MQHDYFMRMALDEAGKGFPDTAPNPMVGCVVVKDNKVISTGYHEKFGAPHAEVNAVKAMPENISPADCTLYISLEPCSHHGKTPPCTGLIIKSGFRKVVVSVTDPNPKVSGKGLKALQDAGIEVITGVLEKEARELNRHFFTFHEKKRPYLILKWAQTADGFISRSPVPLQREKNVITREEAQIFVHKLRSEVMAVFVGKNTVLADNPSLTTRLVEGKNPVRMFVDRKLEVPKDFRVYDHESETIVFNSLRDEKKGNIRFVKVDFGNELPDTICNKLRELEIQSVLVEGGAVLVNSFVEKDLWDEVLVFVNPDLRFGSGVKAPVFPVKNSFELIGDDKLYRHVKNESTMPPELIPKEIF